MTEPRRSPHVLPDVTDDQVKLLPDGKRRPGRKSKPATARRESSRRYEAERARDARRPYPISVRLDPDQVAQVDALREPGEGRATAIKRLAGLL